MFAHLSLTSVLDRIAALSPAGYAIALHVQFTTARYVFQTYDSAWAEYYSQHGLVLHDPVVRWGISHEGARRWSDMEAEDTMGVLEAARQHGLAYGVSVANLLDGSRSFGGFARSDRPHTDDEIAELELLLTRLARMTADPDALPEQEREALHALSVVQTHS
ncbi:MAG: autoinducer binding domain-containing protein [Paracoccaceae bacterium]